MPRDFGEELLSPGGPPVWTAAAMVGLPTPTGQDANRISEAVS